MSDSQQGSPPASGRMRFRLGLVGYGEIGSTLGRGLREAGFEAISSYDKYAFDGPFSDLIQSRAKAAGVTLVRSNRELAEEADLIIGVAPGSASLESADAFAPVLNARHSFIDIASATPKVKLGVEERLRSTGALVGDGSIMGTPRNGYSMPILSSGPAGPRMAELLVPWGMRIDCVGEHLGTASGIKILRSVLLKGIEALIDETLLACRVYGLEDAVLGSAAKVLARPWLDTVESVMPSGTIHAKRRAEEVEMAAEAVADAGVDPIMAHATAARLRWKEALGLKEQLKGIAPANYRLALDAIVAAAEARGRPPR